jgi:integrase
MLHKALADAARKGTVLRNVAAVADPPRLSSAPRPEMKVWDAKQVRQFLQGITSHRLYPAFYLLATTGMRRGELLGLRWSDVDLDGQSISVSRALVIVAYEPQLSDVKDRPGSPDHRPRTQDGCGPTCLEETPEGRAHVHPPAARNRLDVRSPGRIVDQSGLLQPGLRSPCRKSALQAIRLRYLRHTHASILLKQGVPLKVVSERLGHSNPAFTLSV